MSTKHAMIPLVALLPLGLVACDELAENNEGTDASTAGGADAGRTDGGGLFGGSGGNGGGGGGLFGGRSDDEASNDGSGGSGTGGGDDNPGGEDDFEFPDIEPGENVAAAEALFDDLIEDYCELAAPCYGYTVEDCVEYYTNSDYFGEYIDFFSNAPTACLDALRAYTECDASFEECVDGELVSDYDASEEACYELSEAQDAACAEFFEEFFGGYYGYDDYDDYGYDEPVEPPFPDEDGEFSCDGGTYSIPLDWVCDGDVDCEDGSDEEGC